MISEARTMPPLAGPPSAGRSASIAAAVAGSAFMPGLRARLFARHQGDRLLLEVDERLAGDVDDDLLDRSARERIRPDARVVVGHRLARVLAHVQALPNQREVAGLGHDRALAHLL